MKTANLTVNKTAREAQTDSGFQYLDCIWKMKDVRDDTPPDDSPETKIQRATVQNSSIRDSCPLCCVIPDFTYLRPEGMKCCKASANTADVTAKGGVVLKIFSRATP